MPGSRELRGRDGRRRAAATGPVLVVHGGAGAQPSNRDRRAHLAAVREALQRGSRSLSYSADEAVVAAVAFMEAETDLNAGRGATLDRDGRVTLDAGFMEGHDLRYGAVGCVTRTATPIVLARGLSSDGSFGRFLVGASADALVGRYGALPCEPEELVTERARSVWRRATAAALATDTVGAVALDQHGRLAAAVSTGGLSRKPAGRVGDSAVVGAGFWAEQPLGACVTTGIGEAMMREGTARRCVRLLAEGCTPQSAARKALEELSRGDSHPAAGLILVSAEGAVVLAHTSPVMNAGYVRPEENPRVRTVWERSTSG